MVRRLVSLGATLFFLFALTDVASAQRRPTAAPTVIGLSIEGRDVDPVAVRLDIAERTRSRVVALTDPDGPHAPRLVMASLANDEATLVLVYVDQRGRRMTRVIVRAPDDPRSGPGTSRWVSDAVLALLADAPPVRSPLVADLIDPFAERPTGVAVPEVLDPFADDLRRAVPEDVVDPWSEERPETGRQLSPPPPQSP